MIIFKQLSFTIYRLINKQRIHLLYKSLLLVVILCISSVLSIPSSQLYAAETALQSYDGQYTVLKIKGGQRLVVENNGNVGVGKTSTSALLDINGGFKFESTNPGSTDVILENSILYIGGADKDTNNWHNGILNVRGDVKIQNADFKVSGGSASGEFNITDTGEFDVKKADDGRDYFLYRGDYFSSSVKLGTTDKSIPVPANTSSPLIDTNALGSEAIPQDAGIISFASAQTEPSSYFDGSNFKAGKKGWYFIYGRMTFVANQFGSWPYNTKDDSDPKKEIAKLELIRSSDSSVLNTVYLNTYAMAYDYHCWLNVTIMDTVLLDVGDSVYINFSYIDGKNEPHLHIGDRTFTAFLIGKE